MTLERVEINPSKPPVGSVIWLHGLGADGHDFEPIVTELHLEVPVRFVFPHAPMRPVTINRGLEMRAWYDIDPKAPRSGTTDIAKSAEKIEMLVEEESARGIPPEKIVLAGFSQGGVIALHLGLSSPKRLAGILALSTYVHDHERIAERVSFASIDVPIFMAHGLIDPMIPITRAITSREVLVSLNYQIEWHEYAMGHEVCAKEILDVARWLERRF
jgi:phospholipase/carboxylesterase